MMYYMGPVFVIIIYIRKYYLFVGSVFKTVGNFDPQVVGIIREKVNVTVGSQVSLMVPYMFLENLINLRFPYTKFTVSDSISRIVNVIFFTFLLKVKNVFFGKTD